MTITSLSPYAPPQVGNWVAHSILQNTELEDRVETLQQFITIAKVTRVDTCTTSDVTLWCSS